MFIGRAKMLQSGKRFEERGGIGERNVARAASRERNLVRASCTDASTRHTVRADWSARQPANRAAQESRSGRDKAIDTSTYCRKVAAADRSRPASRICPCSAATRKNVVMVDTRSICRPTKISRHASSRVMRSPCAPLIARSCVASVSSVRVSKHAVVTLHAGRGLQLDQCIAEIISCREDRAPVIGRKTSANLAARTRLARQILADARRRAAARQGS